MTTKTAFLIFAQTATAESKQIPNADLLFNALNKDILNKVKQTNIPYFVSSEKDQTGHTFGDKFTHAISEVFKKGYDYVIAIGNDTPEITTGILKKAVKNISHNKLSFGPSKDGGFYLMTFSKQEFKAQDYQKLSWQTSAILKETFALINQKSLHTKAILAPLKDIDTVKDLAAVFLQHKHISLAIKELLNLLVALKTTVFYHSKTQFSSITNSSLYNKGSPVALYI